jgi:hypothetical protein
MGCGTCNKSSSLCPVSFGVALGLTCGLAVYVWMAWVMWMGMPADVAGHMVPPANIADATMMAGKCFLKGLFFGFFLALFYDLIRCCCKSRCCCSKSGSCGCGNPACTCKTNGNLPK